MDIFGSSAQYFMHLIDQSAHYFAYLIHWYGLVAVAAIVGLECFGVPVLSGETALLGAAIYAGTKHDLNIIAVILVAAGAAIVGRMIGYVIGHEFGYWLLLRYGHYVGLTTGRIKLGQYLFLRYGGKVIFIAQFVPALRSLAGLFAGANLMPWRNFMFANAVSSGVWAAGYGYAAYWAGSELLRLQGRMVFLLALVVLIALIAGRLFLRSVTVSRSGHFVAFIRLLKSLSASSEALK